MTTETKYTAEHGVLISSWHDNTTEIIICLVLMLTAYNAIDRRLCCWDWDGVTSVDRSAPATAAEPSVCHHWQYNTVTCPLLAGPVVIGSTAPSSYHHGFHLIQTGQCNNIISSIRNTST